MMVLTVALLISTHLAQAQSADPRVLRANLERASQNQAAACPAGNTTAKEFLFVFDGANGYCPVHFEVWKPAPVQEGTWYNNLTALDSDHPLNELRHWMTAEYNRERRKHNCALIESLLDRQRMREDLSEKRQMLYYSKEDDDQALQCAQSIIESRAASGSEIPTFRVIGFSMGGTAAIEFAKGLKAMGHPVETGLTIDPVGRGTSSLKSVFNKKANLDLDVTGLYTRKWMSVYQRLDRKSLKIVGLQGEIIEGARNADLSDLLPEDRDVRNHAHVFILEVFELRSFINELLYP